jgi:hypothetical protein
MEWLLLTCSGFIPFVFLWLGLELRSEPMNRQRAWVAFSAALTLTVLAIGAGIRVDIVAKRKVEVAEKTAEDQRVRRDNVRAKMAKQLEMAEGIGSRMPKGCPKKATLAAADAWTRKVNDWRAETARLLNEYRPDLATTFIGEQSDYPHRCPTEWARTRLDYFSGQLRLVITGLRE